MKSQTSLKQTLNSDTFSFKGEDYIIEQAPGGSEYITKNGEYIANVGNITKGYIEFCFTYMCTYIELEINRELIIIK